MNRAAAGGDRNANSILIVEGRTGPARHALALLTLHGYDVRREATSGAGVASAQSVRPDLLIVSLDIDEGLSDSASLQRLGALGVPTIARSGFGGELADRMADALHARPVLRNPVSDSDLLKAVRAVLPVAGRHPQP